PVIVDQTTARGRSAAEAERGMSNQAAAERPKIRMSTGLGAPPTECREPLHTHRVVAAVDVQRRTRDVARSVAEEECAGRADIVRAHMSMERGALLDDVLHRREAGDRTGRERAHRSGGDRVHADVLLAEIPGEITDAGV